MKIRFDSPAERQQYHQYIREAAREIDENTNLLQILFRLENGTDKHSSNGFGYIEKNEPQSSLVRFSEISESELRKIVDVLESATAEDLGNSNDKQLKTLADNLTAVGQKLEESI